MMASGLAPPTTVYLKALEDAVEACNTNLSSQTTLLDAWEICIKPYWVARENYINQNPTLSAPPQDLVPEFELSDALDVVFEAKRASLKNTPADSKLNNAFGFSGAVEFTYDEITLLLSSDTPTIIVSPVGDDSDPDPEPFNSCGGGSGHQGLVARPVVAFRRFLSGAQIIYQASPAKYGQFRLAPASLVGRTLDDLLNDSAIKNVSPGGGGREINPSKSNLLVLRSEWKGIVGVAHREETNFEDLRPPTKAEKGTRRLPQILVKIKWKSGLSSWETFTDIAKIRGTAARKEIYDAAQFFWKEFDTWASANSCQAPVE